MNKSIMTSLVVSALSAQAVSANSAIGFFNPDYLPWVNIVVGTISAVWAATLYRQTRHLFGRAFLWLTASIVFLVAVVVYHRIHDGLELGWHALFFPGAILLTIAFKSLGSLEIRRKKKDMIIDSRVSVILGAMAVWIAAALLWAPRVEGWLQTFTAYKMLLYVSGYCIATFILIGIAWVWLVRLRHTFGRMQSNSVIPFVIALTFYGLVHFAEMSHFWSAFHIAQPWPSIAEDLIFLALMASAWFALHRMRTLIAAPPTTFL